ncbi:acyl carrier protein [Spirosoma arcticum]
MTRHQLNERLLTLLVSKGATPTALTDEANFNRDLGLDSLDVTDVLLDVESSFSIRIPDEDWWLLQTVGQLKAYLANEVLFDQDQPDRLIPSHNVYGTAVGINTPS